MPKLSKKFFARYACYFSPPNFGVPPHLKHHPLIIKHNRPSPMFSMQSRNTGWSEVPSGILNNFLVSNFHFFLGKKKLLPLISIYLDFAEVLGIFSKNLLSRYGSIFTRYSYISFYQPV